MVCFLYQQSRFDDDRDHDVHEVYDDDFYDGDGDDYDAGGGAAAGGSDCDW